jgi:uncharacterized protein
VEGRALRRLVRRHGLRVAVLSDTHLPRGARRLPDACLRELERAELILHGGDVVAASVLEELRELAPVEAVRGNMDRPELSLLPERRVVEAGGARIGMIHDAGPRAGREDRLVGAFPGCSAVVYGHTHVPQVERVGGVWILNPGSPTERRRAPIRSLLVLVVEEGRISPRLVEVSRAGGLGELFLRAKSVGRVRVALQSLRAGAIGNLCCG